MSNQLLWGYSTGTWEGGKSVDVAKRLTPLCKRLQGRAFARVMQGPAVACRRRWAHCQLQVRQSQIPEKERNMPCPRSPLWNMFRLINRVLDRGRQQRLLIAEAPVHSVHVPSWSSHCRPFPYLAQEATKEALSQAQGGQRLSLAGTATTLFSTALLGFPSQRPHLSRIDGQAGCLQE